MIQKWYLCSWTYRQPSYPLRVLASGYISWALSGKILNLVMRHFTPPIERLHSL